jgi:hypothetical protein
LSPQSHRVVSLGSPIVGAYSHSIFGCDIFITFDLRNMAASKTSIEGWHLVSKIDFERATAVDVAGSAHAEVRVRSQHGVGLYDHETKITEVEEGTVVLTSHNLFFQSRCDATEVHFRLYLGHVAGVKPVHRLPGMTYFSSPKIVVKLTNSERHTKLSFRQGGLAEFIADLNVMLEKRRWMSAAPSPPRALAAASSSITGPTTPTTTTTPPTAQPHATQGGQVPATGLAASPTTSSGYRASSTTASMDRHGGLAVTERAGIRGLVDKRDAEYEEKQTALRSASRDIDELMKNASQVQNLIRAMKASARGRAAAGDSSQLDELEVRFGIAAPVSRADFGSGQEGRWVDELTRELGTWLRKHPALRNRPSVPLTELFALYNRARGGPNAVSPADLLKACETLPHGGADRDRGDWNVGKNAEGVVLLYQNHTRSLALDVVARLLQTPVETSALPATAADESTAAEERLVRQYSMGVRAAELATELRVHVSEAAAALEFFESQGLLCRGAPRGLHGGSMRPLFYWNPFLVQSRLP